MAILKLNKPFDQFESVYKLCFDCKPDNDYFQGSKDGDLKPEKILGQKFNPLNLRHVSSEIAFTHFLTLSKKVIQIRFHVFCNLNQVTDSH